MVDIIFGVLLFFSAFTGATLIASYYILSHNHLHDYWSHTDRVNPELSHGNSEPHT